MNKVIASIGFPQFGPGAIQQHGFARNVDWDVVDQSESKLVLQLTENDYTMSRRAAA